LSIDINNLQVGGGFIPENPLDNKIQSTRQPSPKMIRRIAKDRAILGLKKEALADIVQNPPAENECFHIVSNGRWDYYSFIPLILGWIQTADEFYGSTWTMNRGNAKDLLGLYDAGDIKRITMVSGNYFLKRESAVAATLIEGLQERGQRFKCWENHTKIILLSNHESNSWFCVEGSANFTANPRTEQNILINSKEIYDFHKAWIDEMFNG
jgi:hypothetical protein